MRTCADANGNLGLVERPAHDDHLMRALMSTYLPGDVRVSPRPLKTWRSEPVPCDPFRGAQAASSALRDEARSRRG